MIILQKQCLVLMTGLALVALISDVSPSYPPSMSYGSHHYPSSSFLPAESGKMPPCANDPRLTFCLELEKYPKDRIIYLIENKMYDADTFLQDETRDTYTFEAREAPTIKTMYRQPEPSRGYPMTVSHYLPPPQNFSVNYDHQRPSKYGAPHHLKPPFPQSAQNMYSVNTTPPLNSFTSSFYNKYDTPQRSHSRQRSTYPIQDNGGPYPRYNKNDRFTAPVASQEPPRQQQHWWKKILRREKRQLPVLNALCPSRANYIMPRAAQNVAGDWMFLVNVDNRYTQLVKSETCVQNHCDGGCEVPPGFAAICQQQYVQKRLVALDGSGTKLNSDTFWFPSCCVCKLREITG